jgi:hypothetical protein
MSRIHIAEAAVSGDLASRYFTGHLQRDARRRSNTGQRRLCFQSPPGGSELEPEGAVEGPRASVGVSGHPRLFNGELGGIHKWWPMASLRLAHQRGLCRHGRASRCDLRRRACRHPRIIGMAEVNDELRTGRRTAIGATRAPQNALLAGLLSLEQLSPAYLNETLFP